MAALIGLVVGALIGGVAGGRGGASFGGLIGFVIGVVIAIRRERREASEPPMVPADSVAAGVDATLAQRVVVLERRVADLEYALRTRSAIAAGASADAASTRTVPVVAPSSDRGTVCPFRRMRLYPSPHLHLKRPAPYRARSIPTARERLR